MAKALVVYASTTGNTQVIADTICSSLREKGWQVDCVKVQEEFPPKQIDFDRYHLLCAGSHVHWSLPSQPLIDLLRSPGIPNHKIVPGPRCGISFATYGGFHLGPREADPCLTYIEVLCEHLGFNTVGRLAVPGQFGEMIRPQVFHPDLQMRPNSSDVLKVRNYLDELHNQPELSDLLRRAATVS